MWPLRTMLFIPAHKLDWVKKVQRWQPDSVVLDLEDAVPEHLKTEARLMAREGVGVLREMGIPAFVRINAMERHGIDDLAEIVCEGLVGIMLPKTDSVEDVRELDRHLCHAEGCAGLPIGSVDVLPIPETAAGMWVARDLAAASARCKGLLGVMGGPVSGDVARAMGFLPTEDGREQIYLSSKIVLASRAAGARWPMASIIGTEIEDLRLVRILAQRAKHAGFSGAVLIHPSHIAVAAEVFVPSQEEIDYYAGLVDTMQEAVRRGDAAVRYRGRMVDYAMVPLAEEVLQEAERRKRRGR